MHRIFFVLLLLTCHCLLFSQSKTQTKLALLERQRFVAMTQKDTAFLAGVLADDLTYGHSNGLLENKQQHLANIASDHIAYQEMEPLEMSVRHDRRAAVINGLVRVKGLYDGKEFNIRLRYLDIYRRKKGKWQLVAWQSVKVE